jgi:hypothetical protein
LLLPPRLAGRACTGERIKVFIVFVSYRLLVLLVLLFLHLLFSFVLVGFL